MKTNRATPPNLDSKSSEWSLCSESTELGSCEWKEFYAFLAKHFESPILFIVGDSCSSLAKFYQLLPSALQITAISSLPFVGNLETRLVSHDLAAKGREYCLEARQFVSINPLTTVKNPTANERKAAGDDMSLNAKDKLVLFPNGFTNPLCERAKGASMEVDRAETTSHPKVPLPSAHSENKQVRWVVPRFVLHTHGLEELLNIWGTHENVQFIFFVNTDLAEDLPLGNRKSFALILNPSLSEVSKGLRAKVTRVFLGRLGHDRCFSPFSFFPQLGCSGCDASSVGVLSCDTRGVTGDNEGCALFPTLFLEKICQATPLRRQIILNRMRNGLDPFSLFKRTSVTLEEERAERYVKAACSKKFDIFAYVKLAKYDFMSRVFVDERSALKFKENARTENHLYGQLLANLKDSSPLTPNQRAGGVKGKVEEEKQNIVHDAVRMRKVRNYFPLVIHAGALLHRKCCLTDIFVFEFSEEVMHLKSTLIEPHCSSMSESKESIRSLANLLKAAKEYLTFRDSMCSERLVSAVCSYVRLLTPHRLALCWSMTDPVERIPRFAFCLSYEVFSHYPFKTLCTVPPKKTAFSSAWDDASVRGGLCKEKVDPTTMEYQLRTLIRFLRQSGWLLIHQEDHRLWDTASFLIHCLPPEEEVAVKAKEAPEHVLCRTLPTKSTPIHPEMKITNHPSLSKWTKNESSRMAPLAPLRTVFTSLELWQASLVPPSAGLYLWRGIVVSTPSGRTGVVVDFKTIPRRHLTWGVTSSPFTARFLTWYRSQCRLLVQGGGPEFVKPRWKPALPPYIDTMETCQWPLVFFPKQKTFELVLPTMTTTHFVKYPTACFVSAAQQLEAYRKCASLDIRSVKNYFTTFKDATTEDVSIRHRLMQAKPHERIVGDVSQKGYARDVFWRLPWYSKADQKVITAQLSLQLTVCENVASLYIEAALNFNHLNALPHTPFGLTSCNHKHLLLEWIRLHNTVIPGLPMGIGMASVSRTSVPLGAQRLISTASFLKRPRALRGVVAALPYLSNAMLD